MSSIHAKWSRALVAQGHRLKRDGMSQAALAAMAECDGSYKGVMIMAGRLKAIAKMAEADLYWLEQVQKGYQRELDRALQAAHEERAARAGNRQKEPAK